MGDRVPTPDAMEYVPVGTNQDMASKKVVAVAVVRGAGDRRCACARNTCKSLAACSGQ